MCPALDGRFDVPVEGADGLTHLVRLLTYLDGEPLHRTTPSMAQAAALGTCLAALGLALRDFAHPAAHRDLLWDLRRAPKLRPLLPLVADPRCRTLATAALDRYETVVVPQLPAFRTQLTHNDFNPHNILVAAADPRIVAGVLDFGDMVQTALVNDVAIAAAYQVEGDDPLERPCALVAAYHGLSPLREVELDSLFDLIALRHVLSVTITEWRASLYPDNAAYILRNHARAVAALDSLDRIGPVLGTARLRRACGLE
jgi:Ser/Thr protein kinase RdoA (MazF antagonist)